MIFLASPYTHEDKDLEQVRYELACDACAHLFRAGYVVYSPIVHWHPIARMHNLDGAYEHFERNSIELIKRADALWILTLAGWQDSIGIRSEIEVARLNNKPVYTLDAYSYSEQLLKECQSI